MTSKKKLILMEKKFFFSLRFEFPLDLDLNELAENDENDKANYTYKLYAVLTHAGDFHSLF
jgi:hypothetical protein